MSKERIVVIEDETDMREELRDLLLYERFEVACAATATEGWQLILDEQPDLVLCNVRLQDGDGFELLERFRREPSCTLTPFVFLTARSTPDDFRKAMNLGADDYLVKPIMSAELLAALRARLGRYQAIRSHHKEAFGLHQRLLLHYFPHELFTPLNALLGLTRAIRRKAGEMPTDRLKLMADTMLKNGARLYHLLQNQLLYLEMESGEFQERLSAGDLSLEISPQLTLLARERATYYDRGDDLQLHLENGSVRMFEKHFQVVARELIDNAFKFSDPGTPVLVSTRLLDEHWLQLRVVNAGSGLSPEQISEIGAFTQFDRQRKEQQGMGLGLLLTRRVLQVYGYNMDIDSIPDRYTQLEVKLAAAPHSS